MYTVYQITNTINGKSYVGFTIINPNRRFSRHKQLAKSGKGFLLHSSIRKYGSSNFVLEILEQGWNPQLGLEFREPFWIETLKPEYNMTTGGEGKPGRTAWNKGIPMSQEMRTRLHTNNLGMGKGISKSVEHRRKLSEANKGQIPWNKGTQRENSCGNVELPQSKI